MKKEAKNKIVDWEEHLDKKYGKKGNMTQSELAEKAGTTKNYISRIENDASDIRLTTLMRIVREGLGGHLTLSLDF
jgi:transcriptional regulator with XRE-family HTH domain